MRVVASLISCVIILFATPSHAQDKAASPPSDTAETQGVFSQFVTPATKGNGEIGIVTHVLPNRPPEHSCSGRCGGAQIGSWACTGDICALDCTTSPPRTYCARQ
jgi:hypothetical protein